MSIGSGVFQYAIQNVRLGSEENHEKP